MSLQAVSKHLKVLERAGLMARGRSAQLRRSRLQGEALKEASEWVSEFRGFWEESFDRLEEHLPAVISITRVFDAPREQVWRAWTEPERLATWWGKRGWSTPVASVELDVRPGGVFRLNSINDEDGREMPMDAVYREVVEAERLVFERHDGATSRSRSWTSATGGPRCDSRRAANVRDAAAAGLASAFDRLEESLS